MSDHILVVAENNFNAGQLDNLKALIGEVTDTIQQLFICRGYLGGDADTGGAAYNASKGPFVR